MQLASPSLYLLLVSLALAGLGEAGYKPPTTYSPDYKQCRSGNTVSCEATDVFGNLYAQDKLPPPDLLTQPAQDSNCTAVISDQQVADLRSKGQRFTLLNQKHPELKTIHASASRSAASASKAAVAAAATPKAPALVNQEFGTTGIPDAAGGWPDDTDASEDGSAVGQSTSDGIQDDPAGVVDTTSDMASSTTTVSQMSARATSPTANLAPTKRHEYDWISPDGRSAIASVEVDSGSIHADTSRRSTSATHGWTRPHIKRDTTDFSLPTFSLG
ncbi:hypothetical protein IAU60_002588 [Kwoniella sp. DSM 27419]